MTDIKPSAENVERAERFFDRILREGAASLSAEFAASDAIARRRAIEACIVAIERCQVNARSAVEIGRVVRELRAILRAPTGEKAKCPDCGGTGVMRGTEESSGGTMQDWAIKCQCVATHGQPSGEGE